MSTTTVTTSEGTSCRVATDDDIPGLLRLLEDAEWGNVDEATWRSWYRDGLYGPSIIVVSQDPSGTLLGQLELRPSRLLTTHGEVVSAHRLGSLALSPSLRTAQWRGRDHPLAQLYDSARSCAQSQGSAFVHALPHRVIALVMRSAGVAFSTFGCVGLDLATVEPTADASGLGRLDVIDDEFDDLWERGCNSLAIGFAVVRDAQGVAARLGGDEMHALRDDRGRLRGYAVLRASDGLLVDLFGDSPESIRVVVTRLVGATAARHRSGTFVPAKITALDIPSLQPILAEVGFRRVRYGFYLFAESLGSPALDNLGDKQRWYLTGGD